VLGAPTRLSISESASRLQEELEVERENVAAAQPGRQRRT